MKKLFILFCFLSLFGFTYGQQVPVISNHMFNRLILNPAYAGSQEQLSASILHRSQWIGIKESPSTQLFSLDAPVNNKVGVGVNIGNDHAGVTSQTELLGSVSYNVGGSGFSLGLRGGFSYYRASLSQAFVWQPEDPVFSGDIKSALLPKFGFGMYYSDGLFYAGLSIPDLLVYDAKDIFVSADGSFRNIKKNYILTAGYSHILTNDIHIEPSMLIKYHPTFPLLVDVNCNIRFTDQFLAGLSYRYKNAFVGLVQLKVMEKIKVGYAFDIYQSNTLSNYFGTHEIMVAYNLGIE